MPAMPAVVGVSGAEVRAVERGSTGVLAPSESPVGQVSTSLPLGPQNRRSTAWSPWAVPALSQGGPTHLGRCDRALLPPRPDEQRNRDPREHQLGTEPGSGEPMDGELHEEAAPAIRDERSRRRREGMTGTPRRTLRRESDNGRSGTGGQYHRGQRDRRRNRPAETDRVLGEDEQRAGDRGEERRRPW